MSAQQKVETEATSAAFQAGLEWGRDEATHEELRHLSEMHDAFMQDGWNGTASYTDDGNLSAYTAAEVVVAHILYGSAEYIIRSDAPGFWDKHSDEDGFMPDAEWVEDFVLGALDGFNG